MATSQGTGKGYGTQSISAGGNAAAKFKSVRVLIRATTVTLST